MEIEPTDFSFINQNYDEYSLFSYQNQSYNENIPFIYNYDMVLENWTPEEDNLSSVKDMEESYYFKEIVPITPSVPKENLFYVTIPLRKKYNKKYETNKIPLISFKSNEMEKFIEFNIEKTIEYLGNRIPFHLYVKTSQEFSYFGSVVGIQRNLSITDKTKILLNIAVDGQLFNKISEANNYLKKKYNKEHHRFIASVFYECDEGKEEGSNTKKTLTNIFCQNTKQGKKISAAPDTENGEKVSYQPISELLPLKCTNKKGACECRKRRIRKK